MRAAEHRDPDCPSTVPKHTCTHARMAKMCEDPRRAGDKELWFGQLSLAFAFTCGGQTFIRWYKAVPSGNQETGQVRQTGHVAARNATQMQRLQVGQSQGGRPQLHLVRRRLHRIHPAASLHPA